MRWSRLLWGRLLRHRHEDTTEEALAYLVHLEEREAQVRDLSRELREAKRHNHFSEMVNRAISHAREQH